MAERKRLSDILMNSERDRLEQSWSVVKAADDLKPLPSGDYRARVVKGELFNAKKGTPGFKITLEVLDGEFAGRLLWHDVWLSHAALAMAKRDLAKLGIEKPDQLERPLPEGIIVSVKVALRRNEDGPDFNKITRFDVIAIEPPSPEPFAPADIDHDSSRDDGGFDWRNGEEPKGATR